MVVISSGMDMTSNPSYRKQLWWLGTALVAWFVLLVGWVFHHHSPGEGSVLPGCVFYRLTGIYCTGCGVTRAMYALFQGQLGTALSMNALAVVSIPVATWVWIDWGLGHPHKWRKAMCFIKDARVWAWLILVFTFARNLPWPPMSWLAPGQG